jgi:hypothetical protein
MGVITWLQSLIKEVWMVQIIMLMVEINKEELYKHLGNNKWSGRQAGYRWCT